MLRSFLMTGGDPEIQTRQIIKITKTDFNFDFPATHLDTPFSHPDILVVDESPSIGIETVRSIAAFCAFKPYEYPFRLILIKNAHLLTLEAQNAFLKTLEEPQPRCLIFLLAKIDNLLPTIKSRCMEIELPSVHAVSPSSIDISQFSAFSLPQILSLTSSLKSPGDAVGFCTNLISALHPFLTPDPKHPISSEQTAKLIRHLENSLNYISKNANTSLALDQLAFSLSGTLTNA